MNDHSAKKLVGGETVDRRRSPSKAYPSWQYDALVQRYGDKRVKLIYMVRHAEGTHNVNRDYKSIDQVDARLTKIGIEQCQKLQNELSSLKNKSDKADNINDDDADDDDKKVTNNQRHGLEHLIRHVEDLQDVDVNDDENNDDICVVVSPLTRCIQTALLSFDFLASNINKKKTVPFVAIEDLRETVNYNCDRRRRISEIANEFPKVDFSFCRNDEDEIWMSYRRREQSELSSSSNKNNKVNTTIITRNHLESAELYAVAKRGRQALQFLESLSQSKLVVCTHSAFLRCILNWGQTGGVPKIFDQWLDDQEEHYMRQEKIFDYCYYENDSDDNNDSHKVKLRQSSFEEYMREDYNNAELRSFCLLVQ